MDQDALKHYVVMDAEDRTVGNVAGVWLDEETDAPEFVAVRSGLLGRLHVIPLQRAQLDERRRILRVPYARDAIKDAPAFERGRALSAEDEARVRAHYDDAIAGTYPERAQTTLHREKIHVAKRVVPAGALRIRKVVRTEIVHQPVEVRREEIVVERIPPGELPEHSADALPETPFEEGEVLIPQRREEPVITKTTEAVEDVRAVPDVEVERRVVEAQARREDVEVERLPPRDRD